MPNPTQHDRCFRNRESSLVEIAKPIKEQLQQERETFFEDLKIPVKLKEIIFGTSKQNLESKDQVEDSSSSSDDSLDETKTETPKEKSPASAVTNSTSDDESSNNSSDNSSEDKDLFWVPLDPSVHKT